MLAKTASRADKVVDRYGQIIKTDFPAKIKSDAQLSADLIDDKKYYESLTPPERDAFGNEMLLFYGFETMQISTIFAKSILLND